MKAIKILVVMIIITAVFFSSAIGSAASHSPHWYIKRQGNSTPLFPPEAEKISRYGVFYVDKNATEKNKVLYITFDAGYENGNIESILNTLRDKDVPAAFFLLDNIILKNTDLVLRMADEGHLVCNHTRNHKNLANASTEEIKANLESLEEIYRDKTGREMSKYFRFPEGAYSIEAIKSIDSLGYKTIFWSFAYEDWCNNDQPREEYAFKKVIDNTHNGAIILLHPTSATNAKILPKLIDEWRSMGYRFGTLDELR